MISKPGVLFLNEDWGFLYYCLFICHLFFDVSDSSHNHCQIIPHPGLQGQGLADVLPGSSQALLKLIFYSVFANGSLQSLLGGMRKRDAFRWTLNCRRLWSVFFKIITQWIEPSLLAFLATLFLIQWRFCLCLTRKC